MEHKIISFTTVTGLTPDAYNHLFSRYVNDMAFRIEYGITVITLTEFKKRISVVRLSKLESMRFNEKFGPIINEKKALQKHLSQGGKLCDFKG